MFLYNRFLFYTRVEEIKPYITLVPTPIGNLEDITLRALRVLKEADLIAAEDTRTSGILLKHYEIGTPLMALHQHNEHTRIPQLLDDVERKQLHLALISDAGTPGISDPGFLLVREALKRGITVSCLPGATALIPALVGSGLPCDSFVFEGFLPVKKGRKTKLETLALESRTIVLYESPYRLLRTLEDIGVYMGAEKYVVVAREISKRFETFQRGTAGELLAYFQTHSGEVKGEIVLILAGKD